MTLRPPPDERTPAEVLAFGIVNLDKPPGPSAHQVSAWVRDLVAGAVEDDGLGGEDDGDGQVGADQIDVIDRAAHAGTLDPKVTGCLPIMLGAATRLAPVFLEGEKEYVTVLECHAPVPTDVEAVAREFEGPIYQKPPRKSAVSRRRRVREIYAIEVLETTDRRALLRIRCESGTYVRKLCHDLGLALGTGAHMGDLRRTATEPFDDTTLHPLTDLVDALAFAAEGDEAPLREVVHPAERALTHLPSVTIAESAAEQVAHGAPVYAPGVIAVDEAAVAPAESADEPPLVACYTPAGTAVCLGRVVGDPDASSGVVVALERVLV